MAYLVGGLESGPLDPCFVYITIIGDLLNLKSANIILNRYTNITPIVVYNII